MHPYLVALLFNVVCIVNAAQATTTNASYTAATTITTATTTIHSDSVYVMRYNFSLWTDPPLASVNTGLVTTAARIAVFALQIDGTKVQPVTSPSKTTQAIDGTIRTVWNILLDIEFPKTLAINISMAALSTLSFSSDLQDRLRKEGEGLGSARLTSAQVASPGQDFRPVTIPPWPTTKTNDCGKSPVVGGILTVVLGVFGAGRFYYGYTAMGLGWLIASSIAHTLTAFGYMCVHEALCPRCWKCPEKPRDPYTRGTDTHTSGDDDVWCCFAKMILPIAIPFELGLLGWWIFDIWAMFTHYLKPFNNPDCTFMT